MQYCVLKNELDLINNYVDDDDIILLYWRHFKSFFTLFKYITSIILLKCAVIPFSTGKLKIYDN